MIISDPSGSHAVRVLGPKDLLQVGVQPSGDRTFWQEIINFTSSGDQTIHTPNANRKFYITEMVLSIQTATSIQLKCGSTAISGLIPLAANTPLVAHFSDGKNSVPIGGVNIGEALKINTGSSNFGGGWAAGYEE